jgi:hypothetical protein
MSGTAELRDRLHTARTLQELDALYVEVVGYSIVEDDASATNESVRALLAGIFDEMDLNDRHLLELQLLSAWPGETTPTMH